jgi:hypothetical protein
MIIGAVGIAVEHDAWPRPGDEERGDVVRPDVVKVAGTRKGSAGCCPLICWSATC